MQQVKTTVAGFLCSLPGQGFSPLLRMPKSVRLVRKGLCPEAGAFFGWSVAWLSCSDIRIFQYMLKLCSLEGGKGKPPWLCQETQLGPISVRSIQLHAQWQP